MTFLLLNLRARGVSKALDEDIASPAPKEVTMRRALLFSALTLLAALPAAAHPRVWWGPRRVVVVPPRPIYWAPRPVAVVTPRPVYWVPEPLPRYRRPRVVVSVGGCIR